MTRVSKKCSCLEFFGEDPECIQHGRKSNWAHKHPDITDYIVRFETAQKQLNELAQEASFLIDRLNDFGDEHLSDVAANEWHGHVVHPIARIEAMLEARDREAERRAEIERASQSHAPEVPGEIATDEDA